MNVQTKRNQSNADWYDAHFYHNVQLELASWHKALIPALVAECSEGKKLVELGCGQAQVPRLLVQMGRLVPDCVYGMDQSGEAIDYAKNHLAGAHFSAQDLYAMSYPASFFDLCIMLETIEHLESPDVVLRKIFEILKPGGLFFLSFPNYVHLPWLAVRLLSKALNKPNWIVLQPVDKIYNIFGIKRLICRAGFKFEKGIGNNYGPPVLYSWEKEWMTRWLNRCGMYWWSFHPVLKFRKPLET
jgi:2-polyprenyl-3-methyl-5-hydroxy-6-metoxy-1,4-benzoquinol methylase